ncbi:hypothetical protein E2C01_033480 [Portunus trituberculatus]|uniref:Uncharacterized protein n=1 Tax=Portunus trituberculatus TaxID=210409 RepID=A0A5B7F313_PORTR|nr:hypothetical protein [Portunus trituberculatus]
MEGFMCFVSCLGAPVRLPSSRRRVPGRLTRYLNISTNREGITFDFSPTRVLVVVMDGAAAGRDAPLPPRHLHGHTQRKTDKRTKGITHI